MQPPDHAQAIYINKIVCVCKKKLSANRIIAKA